MLSHLMRGAGVRLFVAFVVLSSGGCSGDDPAGPPKRQAPALPDMSTMTIDLSMFDETAAAPGSSVSETSTPITVSALQGKENFVAAASRVHAIQLIFWGALMAPVSAFALAIHSVPQPQSDGFWLWTYIYTEGEVEYSIFLYGRDSGDRTEWRLEASSNDPELPLDHFVWFEGEVMDRASTGYWQFYEPVLSPPSVRASAAGQTPGTPRVWMGWRALPGRVRELTVFNDDPGSPDVGDTLIFYGAPEVSSIEFIDASDPGAIWNITWYADGSGSIQVPDYDDAAKACWDADHFDAACPE